MGVFGPSLLIESTDSMIGTPHLYSILKMRTDKA
jgi:hypothetical protein